MKLSACGVRDWILARIIFGLRSERGCVMGGCKICCGASKPLQFQLLARAKMNRSEKRTARAEADTGSHARSRFFDQLQGPHSAPLKSGDYLA